MIPIRERIEIPASPARVWPLLSDPAFVVTCIPGASLTAHKGPDVYSGAVAVKFGAITARFHGDATVKYDHAARICDIELRAQDQRGASGLKAATHMAVSGTDTTIVSIDGGFDVSGPLGQFARTGGVHLARELLAQFAANLAAKLKANDPDAATGPAPAAAQPSTSLGAALIWRAFAAWLRDLFGRIVHRNRAKPGT